MIKRKLLQSCSSFSFLLLLLQPPSTVSDISNGCPDILVLTSPNCRVDCSSEPYDFLCVESGDWNTICADLDAIGGLGKAINIHFWDLDVPNQQIDANLLGKSLQFVRAISVTEAPNMAVFPMLRNATSLISLIIIGAPSLTDLPVELLPPSLQFLKLYNTGISRLESDLNESYNLKNLTHLVLQGSNLTYIQSDFFMVFTSLQSLVFVSNAFTLQEVEDEVFVMQSPLSQFVFTKNSFNSMSTSLGALFLQRMLGSLQLAPLADVDLSNNNLPFNAKTLMPLKRLTNAASLFLQGNAFDNTMTLTGLFNEFLNLRELDLSNTTLPISPGTFSGLPYLDTLRIAYNNFVDMTAIDMFQDSNSTLLRVLDLSYNSLTALPEGDLTVAASNLRELDFTGNGLRPVEFPGLVRDTVPNEPIVKHTFANFPDLRYLALGSNNWTEFHGGLLSPLQKLKSVDLSCNFFVHITKDFFVDLPTSLDLINMTFCLTEADNAPVIDDDAFSTLPPIRTLILNKGNLKNWIFYRLRNMRNESLAALENVILQDNTIRFVHEEKFRGLSNLKMLSLKGNALQSMGLSSFRNLTSLKTLIISSNQIVSVDTNDLIGLDNLENLDLHDNKISHIDKGSFDMLPSLVRLYLGKNAISAMNGMFTTGGENLKHLGLQKNQVPCVQRSDLESLSNLKWIYLHNITIPLFVDSGVDDIQLIDQVYVESASSGDNLDCETGYDFPVLHSSEITNKSELFQEDFIRLSIDNPWDWSARKFWAHIAKCYSPMDRNLTNITGNLFCAVNDPKTYIAGAPRYSSSIFLILVSILFTLIPAG